MYITRKTFRVKGCTTGIFIAWIHLEPILFRSFHVLRGPGTNSFLLGFCCDLIDYKKYTSGFIKSSQHDLNNLF